jgi:hypothetical protein
MSDEQDSPPSENCGAASSRTSSTP